MDLFDIPEKHSRGTRLPAAWKPSDEAQAFARGLGLDPEKIADEFRDYWIAKPGKDAVKLDWLATWRNWCRRRQSEPAKFSRFSSKFEKKEVGLPATTPWDARLRNYRAGGFWLEGNWGPRPESGLCWAPAAELEKWKRLAGYES